MHACAKQAPPIKRHQVATSLDVWRPTHKNPRPGGGETPEERDGGAQQKGVGAVTEAATE